MSPFSDSGGAIAPHLTALSVHPLLGFFSLSTTVTETLPLWQEHFSQTPTPVPTPEGRGEDAPLVSTSHRLIDYATPKGTDGQLTFSPMRLNQSPRDCAT